MEYEKKNAEHAVITQQIVLTTGLDGGYSLTLDLVENSDTLNFSGLGKVFQAINPPLNVFSTVGGHILPLLVLGAPMPLYIGVGMGKSGCLTYENLEFEFQLGNTKEAEGTGRFRFRDSMSGEWINVPNCKVQIESTSVDQTKVA
ncbi:DUF1842 domain-containing protein [uncultured Shewanella sp.]|uniref:DUF1842 domain-containing protein n=1 Tax=uncultured Shewanella sp. TaxID=173975 RepID=UPI002622F877|nr:DUF1842 domain-containing protein [uncultured Shewanella sp.]